MDFGWNKPDPASTNQTTTDTTASTSTPTTAAVPTPTPVPPVSAKPWDLPDTKSDTTDIQKTNDGLDFDNVRNDDSFDDNFTVDNQPSDSQDSLESEEDMTPDTTKAASPELDDYNDKKVEEEADKKPSSINDDLATKEDLPKVEEKAEEIKEPATTTPASNPAPLYKPTTTTDMANGKSLADLERDLQAQKDDIDKEMKELEEKTKKMNDLMTRVSEMKQKEADLIKEISSSL